ncbi:MAG: SprT-like domain-containing protein [Candidatus Woesearchaeota archaeon]
MVSSQDPILKQAFIGLYPDAKRLPEMSLSYSARFNEYNGNVRITSGRGFRRIVFRLSRSFEDCDDDIKIGIIQHLLNRVYKTSVKTLEQEFYDSFLKHVTRYASRSDSDPYLKAMFDELNKEYFNDLLEEPTMVFGTDATTTLGHYNFTKDRVTISTALKPRPDLVRYVLYHELLHKKHSYKTSNGRARYHTREFRVDERNYADKDIERKLENFLKNKKRNRIMKTLLDWKR